MLPFLRAQSRTGARYLLVIDIARFYHSVYTHSIPWALHGKVQAKRNRGSSLVGNVLDRLVRNCQDGQTIGIPVGPDSSLLIAEILLGVADRAAAKRLRGIRGFRYIDDYELCFATLSAAEAGILELQNALSDYELALNPAKTRILELPQPLDVTGLQNFGPTRFGVDGSRRRQISSISSARLSNWRKSALAIVF